MKINHIYIIALLTLKRVWNLKEALCLIVISPIIICLTFGYVSYKSPERMNAFIVIENSQQALWDSQMWQIADEFNRYRIKDGAQLFSVITKVDARGEAMQQLDQAKTRAVIIMRGGTTDIQSAEIIMDVTEPVVGGIFERELPYIFEKYSKNISTRQIIELLTQQQHLPDETANHMAAQIVSPFEINLKTNAWKDLKFFDFFAAGTIIQVALSLPLFVSVLALTWPRTLGILERIFASPYRKFEIIVGNMIAYSILAVVITILIIITLKVAFDITLANIGLMLLLAILVAFNAVILGLLVSSLTYKPTESLLVGIIAQLFFSFLMTSMYPWESMHPVAKYASYAIPYTYGVQAARHINMVGASFLEVLPSLAILIGFIIAQALIAIRVLRRQIG